MLPKPESATTLGRLRTKLVGIDQMTWTKPRHDFAKARLRKCKTALAAAQNATQRRHDRAHIPGAMHDDATPQGVVVAVAQAAEPDGAAMPANIETIGAIGARRGR